MEAEIVVLPVIRVERPEVRLGEAESLANVTPLPWVEEHVSRENRKRRGARRSLLPAEGVGV